jgi:hypothetical protein
MNSEVKLAFQAYIEALAESESIKSYLAKEPHAVYVLGESAQIHLYPTSFWTVAKALRAKVERREAPTPPATYWEFHITSKEYGITFRVYTLQEDGDPS